jgi:hypothetical protein
LEAKAEKTTKNYEIKGNKEETIVVGQTVYDVQQ